MQSLAQDRDRPVTAYVQQRLPAYPGDVWLLTLLAVSTGFSAYAIAALDRDTPPPELTWHKPLSGA